MFKKLFEPGNIGKLTLKNRIVMAPMVTCYAVDGEVTERLIHYHEARARGGAGLIVTEASFLTASPGTINVGDDKYIPGLRRLVESIHEAGAKVAMEIQTGRGRQDMVDPATASEFYDPKTGVRARALSIGDIERLLAGQGEAAERARRVGFDAIMIHGGPGRLVSDFLSPVMNKRVDQYGGDVKNRARYAVGLVEASKKRAGEDYPVIFRLTADHRLGGRGFTLEEAKLVSQMLEKAGADAIDITSGSFENIHWAFGPRDLPKGYNIPLAAEIKKMVGIPVMVAGRITDPFIAEEVLEQGKADFVTIGRALLADPEFPQKAMEDRMEDIRPCIHCYECTRAFGEPPPTPMVCAVNAMASREGEIELKGADTPRRILIIGAGPGGMETARVAALRGHKVTIWEQDEKVGGQLNLASVPPYGEEFGELIRYLGFNLRSLGLNLSLGKGLRQARLQSLNLIL